MYSNEEMKGFMCPLPRHRLVKRKTPHSNVEIHEPEAE